MLQLPRRRGKFLETTYEGTKKVKDTKLQMLTTCFEELKMSEDESFDSFYGKLNEVVIEKFNLGEKTEDSKIVRKILRSRRASVQKLLPLKRARTLMTSKLKNLLAHFRPISFLYHHKGRANHLL